MKHFRFLLALFLSGLLCLLSTTTFAASAPKEDYFYIQRATFGVFKKLGHTNTYQLTLRGIDPYVVYFSDRPVRQAGLLTTEQFYQQWNSQQSNSFNKDAPNVGFFGVRVHRLFKGKDINDAITLSEPQYNLARNRITYTATILTTNAASLPKKFKVKNIVLFFDPYCPMC